MLPEISLLRRTVVTETVARHDREPGYLSLALDDQERPHITYWTGLHDDLSVLHYAVRTSQGWQREVVTTTQGAQTAIAIDAMSRPLVAYLDLKAATLNLARQSDSGWQSETVANGVVSFAPGVIRLVASDVDQLAISYYHDDQLMLARLRVDAWQHEAFTGSKGGGYYHDMALTISGDLVVVSANMISQTMQLWRVPAGGTQLQVEVALSPAVLDYLSLALGESDEPQLIFCTPAGLHHAFQVATSWQTELIRNESGAGLFAALAARGRHLKLAYFDANSRTVRLARHLEGRWQFEHGDGEPGKAVGGYATLALDAAGTALVAYCDWDDQAIKFLRDNRPPTTTADHFATIVNRPVTGNILATDTDPDGDPFTLSLPLLAEPTEGTVTISPDGDFTYQPAEGFHGSDQFTYQICDDRGLCSRATVTIAIEVPVRIIREADEGMIGNPSISQIRLELLDGVKGVTFAGILRQNERGEWIAVTESPFSEAFGWHGEESDASLPIWTQQWDIDAGRFGEGPFRWAVYNERGGYHIVYGPAFTMPNRPGLRLRFRGRIAAS